LPEHGRDRCDPGNSAEIQTGLCRPWIMLILRRSSAIARMRRGATRLRSCRLLPASYGGARPDLRDLYVSVTLAHGLSPVDDRGYPASMTPRDLVRDVVATAAPHELPLLDSLGAFHDEQVTALVARRRTSRDPVGFGVVEVSALVTPVVWLVVDEVVKRGVGVTVDGMFARLRSLFRRLFRRQSGAPRAVPPLTPAQLAAVHARVLERAATAGIDARTAEIVADAVVSRLARADVTGPDPKHGLDGSD
jgi:hypothetical protein